MQSLTIHCSDLVSCDTYATYDNREWVVQTCAIIGSRLLDAATFLAIDDVLQMKVKTEKGLALPRTSGCSCFMYCNCYFIKYCSLAQLRLPRKKKFLPRFVKTYQVLPRFIRHDLPRLSKNQPSFSKSYQDLTRIWNRNFKT